METFQSSILKKENCCKMPEQFQCRFCPESFKEVLDFLDHFETHVNKNQTELQQEEQQIEKQNDPNLHRKSENDEEGQENGETIPYICRKDLTDGLKKNEKIEKGNICELCKKSFFRKYDLKLHVKTVHNALCSRKIQKVKIRLFFVKMS